MAVKLIMREKNYFTRRSKRKRKEKIIRQRKKKKIKGVRFQVGKLKDTKKCAKAQICPSTVYLPTYSCACAKQTAIACANRNGIDPFPKPDPTLPAAGGPVGF